MFEDSLICQCLLNSKLPKCSFREKKNLRIVYYLCIIYLSVFVCACPRFSKILISRSPGLTDDLMYFLREILEQEEKILTLETIKVVLK